jgi:hypothetical protein
VKRKDEDVYGLEYDSVGREGTGRRERGGRIGAGTQSKEWNIKRGKGGLEQKRKTGQE